MEKRSFLSALFDLSFKDFLTPRVIEILFVIAIVLAAIVAVVFVVGAFVNSLGFGVLVLILSPIIFLHNIPSACATGTGMSRSLDCHLSHPG